MTDTNWLHQMIKSTNVAYVYSINIDFSKPDEYDQ